MTTLLFLILAYSPHLNVNACETYAPRLDGSEVTVCAGRVVRVAMAPLVFVDSIDDGRAVVISDAGSTWEIDASRLPEGTTEGDSVLLGTNGAMRLQRVTSDDKRRALGARDIGGMVTL